MYDRLRALALALAALLAAPERTVRPPSIAPVEVIHLDIPAEPCPTSEAQAPRCTPFGRNWVRAYPRKPEYG